MEDPVLNYITTFIDNKYLTVDTIITEYESYQIPEVVTKKENSISEGFDINGRVFIELIDTLPENVKELGDITQYLESFKTLQSNGYTPGWGGYHTQTSYNFYSTDGNLGILIFKYSLDNYDEFGIPEDDYEITVRISNVIYKNHKYYYLSKKLEEWLNVEGKPKRQMFLRKLSYEY